tara:strand:+ start:4820 stop:5734 length:915 start_codon:yes stop_codon:yes gene_type:complete
VNNLSGRRKLGFLLGLTAAVMWGLIPIALKGMLTLLDPITMTFFRLSLAAAILTPLLVATRQLPNRAKYLSPKLALRLLGTGVLVAGNYGLFCFGLEKTTPEAAEVMIQIAPMLLLLAGLWIFKEPFSTAQWCGFGCFVFGLMLFFNHHLADLFIAFNAYGMGLLMVAMSGLCWAGYGISQKLLLREFNPQETMLAFYWIGALLMVPFCDFSPLADFDLWQSTLLLSCGVITLVAYGSFAESLLHIEASRASALIALSPLLTVAIMQFIPVWGLPAEPLGWLSLLGALMVVVGSMTTAVATKPV